MDGRPPGRYTFTPGRDGLDDGCCDDCYDGLRCDAGLTIGFPISFPLGILKTSDCHSSVNSAFV